MRVLALGILIVLAGCGLRIGTGAPKDAGIGRLVETIQAARGRNTPEQGQPQELTRATVDAIDRDLVRVQFTKYGIRPIMTRVASREGYDTYLSPQDQTITLQSGVLSHTRGLPFDLLETDFSNDADRVYRFLSAANNLTELRVSCERERAGRETIEIVERSYNTTLIEETCSSNVVAFKNRYWVDGSGAIWKSEQWIGPEHGFAIVEKLN